MSKIAVVYWSGTGNTEAMADFGGKRCTVRRCNCGQDDQR